MKKLRENEGGLIMAASKGTPEAMQLLSSMGSNM